MTRAPWTATAEGSAHAEGSEDRYLAQGQGFEYRYLADDQGSEGLYGKGHTHVEGSEDRDKGSEDRYTAKTTRTWRALRIATLPMTWAPGTATAWSTRMSRAGALNISGAGMFVSFQDS